MAPTTSLYTSLRNKTPGVIDACGHLFPPAVAVPLVSFDSQKGSTSCICLCRGPKGFEDLRRPPKTQVPMTQWHQLQKKRKHEARATLAWNSALGAPEQRGEQDVRVRKAGPVDLLEPQNPSLVLEAKIWGRLAFPVFPGSLLSRNPGKRRVSEKKTG